MPLQGYFKGCKTATIITEMMTWSTHLDHLTRGWGGHFMSENLKTTFKTKGNLVQMTGLDAHH